MTSTTVFTCIQCPIGCPLQLTHEGKKIIEISGFNCNRGDKYARQEFACPRRSISTTIQVDGGLWRRLPVKVSSPIPKDQIIRAAEIIHQLRLKAPVKEGQVIMENILGHEGIHVVSCRDMPRTNFKTPSAEGLKGGWRRREGSHSRADSTRARVGDPQATGPAITIERVLKWVLRPDYFRCLETSLVI